MKNTLVVVADLGCLKAYRLDRTPQRTARLELLEEFKRPGGCSRRANTTTDAAGRFPRGAARQANGMSDGERHNLDLESRRRLVQKLAGDVNRLLRLKGVEGCYLAASRPIHNLLVEGLEPSTRAKVVRSVSADLTKLDKSQLLAHF